MKWYPKDIYQFIKKLRFRKCWNILSIYASFVLTTWLRIPIQWGKPMTISIEPTTACNLGCPECPSGLKSFSRPTGNLKKDFFRQVIDQQYKHLSYLIFYFQGEPFINPDFLGMVQYANSKNIYTISSTNGHFLNEANARRTIESGLDRLIISVDGTTQDTYEQYRIHGSLDKVLEGTRTLVRMKKEMYSNTPHLIFQFLVVKANEHQIDDIYKLADEIGVNEVKLKTAQIYDYQNGNPLIPDNPAYARYRKNENGGYSLAYTIKNQCWKLWHSCVITWDGKVVPCCFDKDASHPMGDLKQQDFKSIWKGQAYQKFRHQILKGRNEIDICTNCTEGCTVWK